MFGINLRVLKIYMGWVFAFTSLMSLVGTFWIIQTTFQMQRQNAFLYPHALMFDVIFPVMAVFFGVAWWIIREGKPSARGWGIAASLALILQTILGRSYCWRSVPIAMCVTVAVGVTGLVAFSRHDEAKTEVYDSEPEDHPF
jgi:hypothetical protein